MKYQLPSTYALLSPWIIISCWQTEWKILWQNKWALTLNRGPMCRKVGNEFAYKNSKSPKTSQNLLTQHARKRNPFFLKCLELRGKWKVLHNTNFLFLIGIALHAIIGIPFQGPMLQRAGWPVGSTCSVLPWRTSPPRNRISWRREQYLSWSRSYPRFMGPEYFRLTPAFTSRDWSVSWGSSIPTTIIISYFSIYFNLNFRFCLQSCTPSYVFRGFNCYSIYTPSYEHRNDILKPNVMPGTSYEFPKYGCCVCKMEEC
jgi:hypothetical protein